RSGVPEQQGRPLQGQCIACLVPRHYWWPSASTMALGKVEVERLGSGADLGPQRCLVEASVGRRHARRALHRLLLLLQTPDHFLRRQPLSGFFLLSFVDGTYHSPLDDFGIENQDAVLAYHGSVVTVFAS